MVVAGDHANNDMAGDDADSWKSQFEASGDFDSVDCQIAGLGRIAAVEDLYVAHTKAAIDSLEHLTMQQQKILMPKQQMTVQTMHRQMTQLRQQLILQRLTLNKNIVQTR